MWEYLGSFGVRSIISTYVIGLIVEIEHFHQTIV